jgi:hypothetical protein
VASTIGIKIANGEFYSIVEENSQVKKRLVLTTVHDNQQSVQIDLYRSSTGTMADAFYIGSLVLEDIKSRSKGEASIELVISSASNGNISADAVDLDASGGRQTLNVSLKSMEENGGADIPDFEFDNNENAPKGLYEESGKKGKKKFPWLLVVLAALVLIAVGLLIWLFFFRGNNPLASFMKPATPVSQSQPAETTPQAPSAPVEQSTPQPEAVQPANPSAEPAAQSTPQPEAPAQPVAVAAQSPTAAAVQIPPPVIQSPAQAPATAASVNRQRPPAPVASYSVPAVIPREGVPYRIRYGDTLWDIADAFYRNPRLYPNIAQFNNIRNPNIIISGTTIIVPPRN